MTKKNTARNDRKGRAMTRKKTARDDKEERYARFIFAGFDTGANGVLNDVMGY